jgi:hypothetical protein
MAHSKDLVPFYRSAHGPASGVTPLFTDCPGNPFLPLQIALETPPDCPRNPHQIALHGNPHYIALETPLYEAPHPYAMKPPLG